HWQGSKRYRDDWQRSMPLAFFRALARIEGVQLFSMQKGYGRGQLKSVDFPVVDLADRLDGAGTGAFMDTAAVMCALDLIVTSDTAIAHLAGALGVQTWVPLGAVSDWRWLLEREDSPWYPTMRLFRRTTGGRWDEVFARMSMELRARLE